MKTLQKRQIFRYGIITVIAFCLAFSCIFLSFGNKVAKAEDTVIGAEEIYVGEVLSAEDWDISYEGGSVTAEGMTVVFPSGGVYGGESFEIDQAGKYTVTYYATVNGNKVEEVKEYLAIRRTKDIIVAEEGMSIGYGEYEVASPYQMQKNITGTVVEFKAGQSITFTTKIKTEKLTRDYNIVEMIVMPSVFNETDFERLNVLIADSENPDNYVELLIDSSNMQDGGGQVSYVRASANGQQYGGYEGNKYHTMNYGTSVEHSFRALGRIGSDRANLTISENLLTVSLDHAERKVYCGPYSPTSVDKLMVNDLDDPTHFKSNPWGGFTSEEVTVTVTANKFIKSTGKVVFTSFGDFDLSKDIIDDEAPQFKFDHDWTQGAPIAEVGKDYPLFQYVVDDVLDNFVNVDVLVYYLSPSGQWVDINHDGEKFFAKYAGQYKIGYFAEDYTGNKTEVWVDVEALETLPRIDVGINEPYIEAEVYEEVILQLPSQVNATGGSGLLQVEREVYSPSGDLVDVNEKLLLSEVGDYQVVYVVTDYVGNQEVYPMTVRSNPSDAPKFVEEPAFESALIKGFNYELPMPTVIESVDGEVVEVVCQVYVNGTLADGNFVADGEIANIRYVAEGVSGVAEWERDIPVVDTEGGKYRSRYFFTEGNMQVVDEKSYLSLVIAGDSSAEFLNALNSSNLSLNLAFDASEINFSAMKFVLTDAIHQDLSVTIRFNYDTVLKSWYMQLNDGTRMSYTTSKEIFTFKYLGENNRVVDTSGEEIASFTIYDGGNAFQGFSDTIFFKVEFEGVVSDSSIKIAQICNQVMGYNKSSIDKATDDIKPLIVLDEAFVVRQRLGSKANIPTARAYDVLSQISEFTIIVSGPNGQTILTSLASEVIDLTLSVAGYYTVTYIAKDTNGNTERIPYGILVNDETTPTLSVTNSLKTEYRSGDKIAVPKYTVSDNGDKYFVQVTLILPDNEMRVLEYNDSGVITSLLDKNSTIYNDDFKSGDGGFIVTKKGRYVLRIVAYDEYYNYTVTEIVFYVK